MKLINTAIAICSLGVFSLLFYTIFLSDIMTPHIQIMHQVLFYVLILLFFVNLIYITLVLYRENLHMKDVQRMMKSKMDEISHYSQAKDSFIASISHELKTPLSSILALSYFLRNTELTQRQADLVSKIEDSSDILLSIINDVLDLSKLKFGGFTINPSSFKLMEIVENVESMFSYQITNRGIQWRYHCDFNPELSIHLDKYRLSQILINLLSNALKFTEKGFISLTVIANPASNDPDSKIDLNLIVEDTGIGISEQDIPLIFKEFEQVEHHMIRGHQGSGLGLTITKRLAESMGGNINVESALDKGSRFTVSLPSIPIEKWQSTGARNDRIIYREDWYDLKPILIVEDTVINGELVQQLLGEMGLESELALNGPSAIEMCHTKGNNHYSLILMDIHMPEMDGYSAATILKKEINVTCPIVAFTATAISDKDDEMYRDIFSGYILKPLRAATLQKELTRYLGFTIDGGMNSNTKEAVDAKNGIEHFGGREDLYLKYLTRFKDNYKDFPEQVKKYIDLGDYKEAHRLVHSMKGMAGMLGMSLLYNVSSSFEESLAKYSPSEVDSKLPEFEQIFNSHITM